MPVPTFAKDNFALTVEALRAAWQREYRSLLAEWFVRRHRERLAELDRGRDGRTA